MASLLTHTNHMLYTSTFPMPRCRSQGLLKSVKPFQLHRFKFPSIRINQSFIRCTKLTPWDPSPIAYAPTDDQSDDFLQSTADIFETLESTQVDESQTVNTEGLVEKNDQPGQELQFIKWPMWLLGPAVLLATGMVPTLWLPISSIFLGSNIASLLSLIGLDCIFNLGATLFLLMADSCSRPKHPTQDCKSKAPFSYQFWNTVATFTGFIVPLSMMLASQKGFLQPQLPSISFAVLLGPYLLLLSVQLMRGLKLGVELSAPEWMMHTIRGLVCWWVLVLGLQLMRVAWFAGLTAGARKDQSSSSDTSAANGIGTN
ncbi:unnamed protein product [Vicia faba]|uniref:Uncharacterized protein n=1 Tax=Vicia faba TaxID=3906 RepID=A0AAV0ZTT4_VICFA|nr:unnamed protein product [Vicia faba]